MVFDVAPRAPYLVQPYGCSPYPFEVPDPACPSGHRHLGVDLTDYTQDGRDYSGSEVHATRAGVVELIGWDSTLEGHDLGPAAVCLRLDEGGWLWFGHLQAAAVADGERVAQGQVVGYGGSLGVSTGPHLHLEYRTRWPSPNGIDQALQGAADPTPYLNYPPAPPAEEDSMPAEVPFPPITLPAGAGPVLELASMVNTGLVRCYVRLRSTTADPCAGSVIATSPADGHPLWSDRLSAPGGGGAATVMLPDDLDCQLEYQHQGPGAGSVGYKVGTR